MKMLFQTRKFIYNDTAMKIEIKIEIKIKVAKYKNANSKPENLFIMIQQYIYKSSKSLKKF